MRKVLISGGGIGGLAASLACARAGAGVALFEQSGEFSEVGAGIQLGPNSMRVLQGWGLKAAVDAVAAFPECLQVRSAVSGQALGLLRLGAQSLARYGAPYATIHRADLHALLFVALQSQAGVVINLNRAATRFESQPDGVLLQTQGGQAVQGDLLVGADGLWSRVRQQLLGDGLPYATGHLAYRALVLQRNLPERLRSQQITVWLGPRLHVVQYPVRGGEWLNVVAIVHGHMAGDFEHWDHSGNGHELQRQMQLTHPTLHDLILAIGTWRLWALSVRPPMQGPQEQAQDRVALLGDAAHPMLPYLAQGAGMALEDAAVLGQVLSDQSADVSALLRQYALRRWQRNARVQARALRNGRIFHARGAVRWGRDAAMKLLGERLLDLPWLYRG
jgi:salicylate hydroxylase